MTTGRAPGYSGRGGQAYHAAADAGFAAWLKRPWDCKVALVALQRFIFIVANYLWQAGHQNLSRSWPGGPCSPLLIGVPQRRHGRPARPYTQLSWPRLVSPVVTRLSRVLLKSKQPLPEFHQRVQVLDVADGTPGVDAPEE